MTFISHNQFYVFIACVAFGVFSAFLLTVTDLIKLKVKNGVLKALFDVVAFLFVAIAYLTYSSLLKFPSLRVYMLCGVFAGILLSLGNFKVILAKFIEMVYNIFKRKRRKKYNERSKS